MFNFSQKDAFQYLNGYVHIVSFVVDNQLQIVNSNRGFDNLSLSNATQYLSDIVDYQGNTNLLAAFEGKINKFNLALFTPEKRKIILEVETKLLIEKDQQFLHLVGVDITQSVKNELLIEKYCLIANKTTSGVIITDALGYTTWVNDGFTKMTGYNLEDIKGMKPGGVLQGKDTEPEVIRRMTQAIRKGEAFEVEVLNYKKNGEEVWVSIICNPFFNKHGGLEGYVAIQTEITKRKQIEQVRLKESHDKYEAVFENALNAIILANNNMECIDVNPAACKMLGFSKEELLGKKINDFSKNGEQAIATWKNFIEQGSLEGEIELVGKNNTPKKAAFYAKSNILKDTHLSILLDISEKERMQQDLIVKNENLHKLNEEKNKLFSIISHDLRSPLSKLAGLLNLIKGSDLTKEEFLKYTEELSDDVNDTANLLNNLLIWSSTMLEGMRVNPVSFNLKELADEHLRLQKRNTSKNKIKIENLITIPTIVFADKNMIDIILRNLISNAIKFCRENSKISLTAKQHHNEVIICVSDTGIGISKKNQGKLFSGNFTTKGTRSERGNGIGLKLCKDFVERNNGKIWVESELNKGSHFLFTLQTKSWL